MHGVVVAGASERSQPAKQRDGLRTLAGRDAEMSASQLGHNREASPSSQPESMLFPTR